MKINLENAKKIKTLRGFGGSACWWSTAVKDEKTADEIAELLYGDSGLKLNIYRYNVGGGFEEGNVRVANPWRVIESFMNGDGSYDFSKDKNAVNMMKKCLEKGNVDTLIFFANSPHYTQLITRQASGGLIENFSNLRRDCYKDFAKYFIDIAEHFIGEGYPVKYISPINEPQWKWGGGYVWQEGCHYSPVEMRSVFREFARELKSRNSPLRLYGPESGNIDTNTRKYYELLSMDKEIFEYLDAFCYHSYGSDDDVATKKKFGEWVNKYINTPRFDMSEWCELPCKHATDDFESALIMARVIGEDLIYTAVDSWTAWVCVNQTGELRDGKSYSDGLLYADDDFSEYHIAMRYYAMAHYSKFIPSGSESLDIGFDTEKGFSVFAFKNPDGETVLVAVNQSSSKRVIEPDVKFESARVILSNQAEQLKELDANPGKIDVAPMSIATVILK